MAEQPWQLNDTLPLPLAQSFGPPPPARSWGLLTGVLGSEQQLFDSAPAGWSASYFGFSSLIMTAAGTDTTPPQIAMYLFPR